MQKLHGDDVKKEEQTNKHFMSLRTIGEILTGSDPKLSIMFYKGAKIRVDLMPGYIMVPALDFTVKQLEEFVKVSDNIGKA
jgi:hypothetical protein